MPGKKMAKDAPVVRRNLRPRILKQAQLKNTDPPIRSFKQMMQDYADPQQMILCQNIMEKIAQSHSQKSRTRLSTTSLPTDSTDATIQNIYDKFAQNLSQMSRTRLSTTNLPTESTDVPIIPVVPQQPSSAPDSSKEGREIDYLNFFDLEYDSALDDELLLRSPPQTVPLWQQFLPPQTSNCFELFCKMPGKISITCNKHPCDRLENGEGLKMEENASETHPLTNLSEPPLPPFGERFLTNASETNLSELPSDCESALPLFGERYLTNASETNLSELPSDCESALPLFGETFLTNASETNPLKNESELPSKSDSPLPAFGETFVTSIYCLNELTPTYEFPKEVFSDLNSIIMPQEDGEEYNSEIIIQTLGELRPVSPIPPEIEKSFYWSPNVRYLNMMPYVKYFDEKKITESDDPEVEFFQQMSKISEIDEAFTRDYRIRLRKGEIPPDPEWVLNLRKKPGKSSSKRSRTYSGQRGNASKKRLVFEKLEIDKRGRVKKSGGKQQVQTKRRRQNDSGSVKNESFKIVENILNSILEAITLVKDGEAETVVPQTVVKMKMNSDNIQIQGKENKKTNGQCNSEKQAKRKGKNNNESVKNKRFKHYFSVKEIVDNILSSILERITSVKDDEAETVVPQTLVKMDMDGGHFEIQEEDNKKTDGQCKKLLEEADNLGLERVLDDRDEPDSKNISLLCEKFIENKLVFKRKLRHHRKWLNFCKKLESKNSPYIAHAQEHRSKEMLLLANANLSSFLLRNKGGDLQRIIDAISSVAVSGDTRVPVLVMMMATLRAVCSKTEE